MGGWTDCGVARLPQVWLPKSRGQRGGSWLSVDGAPFRMTDTALMPFRERRHGAFARAKGLRCCCLRPV